MMGIKEYHDRNNRVSFIVSNMLFIIVIYY